MQSEADLVLLNNNKNTINKMEQEGEKLVENNKFFKDLATIMKNSDVKMFFDKYFTDMNSIKSTVIYMKVFRLLEKKYESLSEKELSEYVNVYLLHRAMTTDHLRTKLINETLEHLEDNRKPILNITPNALKDKN